MLAGITKIDCSRYLLRSPSTTREGALLKIKFNDRSVGYADCHPWPELGDEPLIIQLEKLILKKQTPLTKRSIHFARIDATARRENRSLFKGLEIPKSHRLITDLTLLTTNDLNTYINEGFDYFKVKLGSNLLAESFLLQLFFNNKNVKLRLDFNEKISQSEFEDFYSRISSLHEKIDFIEDPFSYDEKKWSDVQEKHNLSLACDRHAIQAIGKPHAAKVLILKPAIDAENWIQTGGQKVVVTSYLDHPLGQLAAAWVSVQFPNPSTRIEGLQTHLVYEPTAYSQQIFQKGPNFKIPEGIGFGFDALLKEQKWMPLI